MNGFVMEKKRKKEEPEHDRGGVALRILRPASKSAEEFSLRNEKMSSNNKQSENRFNAEN
ncbi:hypothetical protein OUZ56_017657 [Daphnia magna]|uniref:Uncharacterized protein n=1 Tax=Daphnia magna TaxID=35525 RepID=A0ABR0ATC4_9CRUS|nr:hypothetical protein OUZ56_017657 [Daphnia magna]